MCREAQTLMDQGKVDGMGAIALRPAERGRPERAPRSRSQGCCFTEASPFQVGTQFNVVHVEQKQDKHMDSEVGVRVMALRDSRRCPRC